MIPSGMASPEQLLTALIREGGLRSQTSRYLTEAMSRLPAVYEATVNTVERERWAGLSEGIQPVAHGIRSLARRGSDGGVRFLPAMDGCDISAFEHRQHSESYVVMAPTEYDRPCACRNDWSMHEFGVRGSLGLIATGLTYHVEEPDAATMSLVLKARPGTPAHASNGITVVTIGLTGEKKCMSYHQHPIEAPQFLRIKLGYQEVPKYYGSEGSGVDSHLGFPRAADYLVGALPRIGDYLDEIAADMETHVCED